MTTTKKILIISYYYFPEIMAASFRMHAWAKYLKCFGWEPIILTKSDNKNNKRIHKNTTKTLIKEIDQEIKCIIYRVPYKQSFEKIWNFKKKLEYKSNLSNNEILTRKVLNFTTRNFFLLPDDKSGWFENAHKASLAIIKKHSIKAVLSTGAPWTDFKVAHYANKKTGIPWIADYRDPWTQLTTLKLKKRDWIWFIFSRIYERKIVRSASAIIHIEENYSKQLERILKKRVYYIPNGFDPWKFKKFYQIKSDSSIFRLSCIGTKHPAENPTIFLEGFHIFVNENKISPEKCKIEFIGHGHENIKKEFAAFHKIEKYINFKPPISQDKAIKIMHRSHILLLFSSNIEGVCSAKMFDYLASKRKILVTPNGKHISLIKKILCKTDGGLVLNNSEQIANWLKERYDEFVKTKQIKSNTKWSEVKKYSRKKQVKKLSKILENAISKRE